MSEESMSQRRRKAVMKGEPMPESKDGPGEDERSREPHGPEAHTGSTSGAAQSSPDAGYEPLDPPDVTQTILRAVEQRRNDPEFMARLTASIERNRPILDALAPHDGDAGDVTPDGQPRHRVRQVEDFLRARFPVANTERIQQAAWELGDLFEKWLPSTPSAEDDGRAPLRRRVTVSLHEDGESVARWEPSLPAGVNEPDEQTEYVRAVGALMTAQKAYDASCPGPGAEGYVAKLARENGLEAPVRPDSENEHSAPRADDDAGTDTGVVPPTGPNRAPAPVVRSAPDVVTADPPRWTRITYDGGRDVLHEGFDGTTWVPMHEVTGETPSAGHTAYERLAPEVAEAYSKERGGVITGYVVSAIRFTLRHLTNRAAVADGGATCTGAPKKK